MESNNKNYDYIEILTNLVDTLNKKINTHKDEVNKIDKSLTDLISRTVMIRVEDSKKYDNDKKEIIKKLSSMVGSGDLDKILSKYSTQTNLEETVLEFKKLISEIPKPENGYTPIKGKDYFDGYTPVKGVDYFDGYNPIKGKDYIDGYTPIKGVDYSDGYTPIKGKDYFDGKNGEVPKILAGEVITLDPEEDASAELTEKKGKYYLNLKIPRGYGGSHGLDAKINGKNVVNLLAGNNIELIQDGKNLTINVTSKPQIQSDYAQEDNTKPDYIKNKPNISDPQIQTDWNQEDDTQVDFIKNRPINLVSYNEDGYVPYSVYNADYSSYSGYSDYSGYAYADEYGNSIYNNYARLDEYGYLPYNTYYSDYAAQANDSYYAERASADENSANIVATYVKKTQTVNGVALNGNITIPTGGRRVASPVVTTASLTPAYASYDSYKITALASALTINNTTGSPTDTQTLLIQIKDDGTSRALTFGNNFRADIYIPMPTVTTIGKWLDMLFIWNATDSYWDLKATSI